jgi:hypothetical protein
MSPKHVPRQVNSRPSTIGPTRIAVRVLSSGELFDFTFFFRLGFLVGFGEGRRDFAIAAARLAGVVLKRLYDCITCSKGRIVLGRLGCIIRHALFPLRPCTVSDTTSALMIASSVAPVGRPHQLRCVGLT